MKEFKQRLITFIETHCKLSRRRFEERCGLANGTISSIKVKGPSVEIVSKISQMYPELNLNWLFKGESGGTMILESESNNSKLVLPHSTPVNVQSVQAVFITNWKDIQCVVEDALRNVHK